MGKANQTKHPTSHISSKASPAVTALTDAPKSSLLRSAFCPSRYQLSLFASVIRGLDAEHLRIHNTRTGRVQCNHALGPRASVTAWDWGYYDEDPADVQPQDGTKKRKRSHQAPAGPSSEQVALAVGTSESEVHIFSPTKGRVLGILKDAHIHGIKDFKFVDDGRQALAWSLGGDCRLVQWNVQRGTPIRTILLPSEPFHALETSGSMILCASHMVYAYDSETGNEIRRFSASTNPVRLIMHHQTSPTKQPRFLTAAQNDRFLNLFELHGDSAIASLCTEGEVIGADFATLDASIPLQGSSLGQEDPSPSRGGLLAIVNQQGVLELFLDPFQLGWTNMSDRTDSIKARMKQRTRRANAQIHFTSGTHQSPIALVDATLQGGQLVVAWVRGGVNVLFEAVRWQDESSGALRFDGNALYELAKDSVGLGAIINGDGKMQRSQLDESHAVVTNGLPNQLTDADAEENSPEVVVISSGEEESDENDDDEASSDPRQSTNATSLLENHEDNASMNGVRQIAGRSQDLNELPAKSQSEEPEEPSFGDLLRANAPEPVEVLELPSEAAQRSLMPAAVSVQPELPSGMSLSTVLTQSLRTNDSTLLKNCFNVKELAVVRATIERLDSQYVPALLQKLAERLHSHPGRAGSLMVWVQWTLISHGGYLASRHDVMKSLSALHRVVRERSESLQPLLSLKGKLDMLEAQMNLRKAMQKKAQSKEADDDELVVYVEGEEDSDSEVASNVSNQLVEQRQALPDIAMDVDSGTEMPLANGHISGSDEDSDSDENGYLDIEASSTDADSGGDESEIDVDHDDADTDTSEAEGTLPPDRLINRRGKGGQ